MARVTLYVVYVASERRGPKPEILAIYKSQTTALFYPPLRLESTGNSEPSASTNG